MQASRFVEVNGMLNFSANALPLSSVRLATDTTSTPSIFARASHGFPPSPRCPRDRFSSTWISHSNGLQASGHRPRVRSRLFPLPFALCPLSFVCPLPFVLTRVVPQYRCRAGRPRYTEDLKPSWD